VAAPVTETSPLARILVRILLLGTLVAFALYAGSEQVTAADTWWTLAVGRYIVEHHVVPDHEVFSYTYEGAPWFNQEWLSQVLYFELFRVWGGLALALFKFAAVLVAFGLATWIGWRRSGSLLFATGVAVAAVFVCRPFLDIRAQLFLFLGALTVMAILETYRHGARAWTLGLLPIVMLLWVNLHFSFVYGLGLLGLFAGSETLKSMAGLPEAPMPRSRVLWLWAALIGAGLACLANPWHLQALTLPFVMLGHEGGRSEIIEWVPPVLFREDYLNPAFFGYFFVGQVLLAVAATACAPRRFDPGDALLVAVTATMALTARRFVPLFGFVSVPFGAKNLSLVRDRLVTHGAGAPELSRPRAVGGAAIACLAGVVLLAFRFVPEVRATFAPGVFEGLTNDAYFPLGAVEFLKRNPLPGRLFHIYTWGGYLMYWLPDRQVFIDGRAQQVYPLSFYLVNKTAEYGVPGWEDVLDRYQVALVVWPSEGFAEGRRAVTLRQLRQSSNWVCVYDDGRSAVFAHVERGRNWIDAYRAFALRYPDLPKAQLFLVNAYLNANEYVGAREHLREVLRRFPEVGAVSQQVESRLLFDTARTPGDASAWFGVGFYRDVRGDGSGAAEAFRAALERGLGGPQASYARDALDRLERAAQDREARP
jgi:hypothetical protein